MSNLTCYKEATRHLFETTEYHLYRYQRHKREIEEHEASCFGHSQEDNEGIRGSEISDPTARGAISLVNPPLKIEAAQAWVKVIEIAWQEMTMIDKDSAEVLEMFYGLNLPNGRKRRDAVRTVVKLMDKLGVCDRTVYRKREQCVEWVKALALREGLLDPNIRKRNT